jgi:uncharacterized spore protein YtfJ
MTQSSTKHDKPKAPTAEVQTPSNGFANMVQEVVAQVCSSSNVRNVFGEPVTRDGVTLIPVASVVAGFGAGAGAGAEADDGSRSEKGGGAGVGGGFIVRPLGVWEISEAGVYFRRAKSQGRLSSFVAAAVSIVRSRLGRQKP